MLMFYDIHGNGRNYEADDFVGSYRCIDRGIIGSLSANSARRRSHSPPSKNITGSHIWQWDRVARSLRERVGMGIPRTLVPSVLGEYIEEDWRACGTGIWEWVKRVRRPFVWTSAVIVRAGGVYEEYTGGVQRKCQRNYISIRGARAKESASEGGKMTFYFVKANIYNGWGRDAPEASISSLKLFYGATRGKKTREIPELMGFSTLRYFNST